MAKFIVITWNIEGICRGFPSLALFCDLHSPDLIFLSEPQVFNCDMSLFAPQLAHYKFYLNGEDRFDPDIPSDSLHAKGGTLALWKAPLDPYVTVLPSTSPAVLPLLLSIPGLSKSIHIGIYLPTRHLLFSNFI